MEVDLKKLALTLVLRRRIVVLTVAGFLVAGLTLSFAIPKRYRASAKILPPAQDETQIGSSLLSNLQQQIGIQVSGISSAFQTPFDLFIGILKSNTIAGRVVKGCGLVKAYRVRNEGKALEILAKQIDFKPMPEGVLVVTAETRSGRLSAEIANAYLAELDRFLKETNMTRGRNTRLFVEKRLREVETNLAAAEDSLRVFQQRNKTVALEEETKKAVEQYALLKAQTIARETQLEMLKAYATPDNPLYRSTKNEIDQMNRRLGEFESAGSPSGFGVGFGVSFKNMPTVGEEYARRLREVKIQEEIYALLVQQYEQAKIMEARDTPNVIVLEAASPGREPAWPKKGLLTGLAILLGLVVGVMAAFITDWWVRFKQRPDDYGEVRRIAGLIKNDFRFLKRRKDTDATATIRKSKR